MARPRPPSRTDKPRGKRGGMFAGMFIGVLAGLIVAAAMAWYFLGGPAPFRTPDTAPATPSPAKATAPSQPAAPASPAGDEAGRSEYTFFDILPGDKTGKPGGETRPREVWWLQVAALAKAQDADRLKARLSLLGLDVRVQKIPGGTQPLHRVRVGPYKTEADALAALDTLSANQFEPKLLKESTGQP